MTAPSPPAFSEARAYAAVIVAWVAAQLIKILRGVAREKRFNFRWLIDTGGMPSSHSAAVASLTTTTGYYYGFGSIPFGIVLVFSLIIMFDAAGVRRAVGRQASILNLIMGDLERQGRIEERRLKELLGHTPVEVIVGAFLGVLVSALICLS